MPCVAESAADHPALRARVEASLARQGMMQHLGVRLLAVVPGRVVRAGKRIIVTVAEVTHVAADGQRSDCAIMQQTLVPVPKMY